MLLNLGDDRLVVDGAKAKLVDIKSCPHKFRALRHQSYFFQGMFPYGPWDFVVRASELEFNDNFLALVS